MQFQRKVEFSSAYFSGFNLIIDIRYYDSIQQIINYAKDNLLSVLKKYNFIILIQKFNDCDFHIHTHSLEDILLNDNIIYICDHCNSTN